MIELVTGPFRSGKTGAVIERVKTAQHPVLIVPSRMQRDALSLRIAAAQGKGYAGKTVFTLLEAVQQAADAVPDFPSVLSDFECYILFKLLFEENQKRLRYFGNVPLGSGVLRLAFTAVTQMRDGVLLRKSAGEPDGLFPEPDNGPVSRIAGEHPSAKWDDLLILYGEYEKKLSSMRLCDSSLRLLHAADALGRCRVSVNSGGLLALDGFFDFTSCQFEFVKSLIAFYTKCQLPVIVTLPDAGSPVLRRTRDLLEKHFRIRVRPVEGKPASFSSLSHAVLEKKTPDKAFSLPVRTICAFGRYREAELIGNEIKKLVAERGLRYNDIAVITKNPDRYSDTFRQVFHDMDIPLFNSKDEPLKSNPVILFLYSLIRNVLQEKSMDNIGLTALVRSNYFTAKSCPELARSLPVFSAYFRGSPKDWENEIDSHIERCSELRTKSFLGEEETGLTPDELTQKIDRLKKLKAESSGLLGLIFSLDSRFTVDQFLQWLARVIAALGVRDAIRSDGSNGADTALSSKDFTAFRKLLETLRSMKKSLKILGKETFGGEEFFHLFDGLIRDIAYRHQYYPVDCVRILTPFDARETGFRAVFIAGLNEGEFPSRPASSLLDVRERNRFNELAGRIVLESEETLGDSERLDFAVALSRASETLYLTRTPYNESGTEILPSWFWTVTLQANPPVETLELSEELIPSETALAGHGGLFDRKTLSRIGSDVLTEEDIAALSGEYPFMQSAVQMKNYTDAVDAFNDYYESGGEEKPNPPFGKIYAGDLNFEGSEPAGVENREYARNKIARKPLSSSLLETFGNCRYQYFLKYLLDIRPDAYPSQEIQSAFKGLFYHAVLRDYCEKTKELSGKEILEKIGDYRKLLDDIIREQAAVFGPKEGEKGLFALEAEYYRAVLHDFIRFDAENLRDRRPSELEREISRGIDLGKGVSVETVGFIDRVDEQSGDSGKTYRIIDYKSGGVGYINKNAGIPLKVFQGFVYAKAYAMETGRRVDSVAYVSIEANENDSRKGKVETVFPYEAGKDQIVDNFNEIWEQKEKEIRAALELMNRGDFLPFTLESDYPDSMLEFYRPLKSAESDSKCSFCPYTEACQRKSKKIPDW